MKKIGFILFLILFSSCQDYAETQIKTSSAAILPVGAGGTFTKEKIWRVGALRRQKVTKGFTYRVKLPLLKKEDMVQIVEKFKVDSWLVRIRKKGLMRNEVIGYIWLPLFAPGFNRKKEKRILQMKKAVFQIHYKAAAISARLASLPCPPFNHQLRIKDVDVNDSTTPLRRITVSSYQRRTLLAMANKYDYHHVFNGGKSLIGEYIVELAMYNSKKNSIYSNWSPLPNSAIVKGEKRVRIKGCRNYKIPPPSEDGSFLQNFKFGG